MAIWVNSDLHFSHKNILKYNPKTRKFKDVNHMNEYLIIEWNSKIQADDTIYHLGDFAFAGNNKKREILDQLNGTKIFVLGNHDGEGEILKEYGEVHHYIKKHFTVDGKRVKVIMFHYPIASWDSVHHGSVLLHGHTHGSYQMPGRCLDVGYDSVGEIITMDKAIRMCLNKPIASLDPLHTPKTQENRNG